jgi:hypothetical protein
MHQLVLNTGRRFLGLGRGKAEEGLVCKLAPKYTRSRGAGENPRAVVLQIPLPILHYFMGAGRRRAFPAVRVLAHDEVPDRFGELAHVTPGSGNERGGTVLLSWAQRLEQLDGGERDERAGCDVHADRYSTHEADECPGVTSNGGTAARRLGNRLVAD